MNQEEHLRDILGNLQSTCQLNQAQAFSQLMKLVLSLNYDSQKVANNVRETLFDCSFKFGRSPASWFLETFPKLVESGRYLKSDVFTEVLSRISRSSDQRALIHSLLDHCSLDLTDFQILSRRVGVDQVAKVLAKRDSENDQLFSAILLLTNCKDGSVQNLLGHKLNKSSKESFLDDRRSESITKDVSKVDVFTLLEAISKNDRLIRNPSIQPHIALVPSLLSALQMRTVAIREMGFVCSEAEIAQIKNLVLQCQKFKPASITISEEFCGDEQLFNSLVSGGEVDDFVTLLRHNFEHVAQNATLLNFVTALLPYVKNQKETCDLIVKIVKSLPEEVTTLALYFISLFAKPHFIIERSLVLDVLLNITIENRNILQPVLKLLVTMSDKKLPETKKILAALGELVEKYPTIVNSLKPILSTTPNEGMEIFDAKMDLIEKACLATDDNDDLLRILSQLLKSDGSRLARTIKTVAVLSQNQILDFASVHVQLSKSAMKPGNEVAAKEYCEYLAVAVVPDEDETPEEADERRQNVIKELWSLRKERGSLAREVWTSLGKFKMEEVEETLGIGKKELVEMYPEIDGEEVEGFITCMHAWLQLDIENIPRPLYSEQKKIQSIPIFSKVDAWKSELGKSCDKDSWYWRATLALSEHTLDLASVTTVLQTTKELLAGVPPSESFEDAQKLFASWRIYTQRAFDVLVKAKGIIEARNQLVNECRKVLQQSTTSVENVVIILFSLTEVIQKFIEQIDDEKERMVMLNDQKPWLISFVDWCLILAFPKEHASRVHPLFELLVTKHKLTKRITKTVIFMMRKQTDIVSFFKKDLFETDNLLLEDPVGRILSGSPKEEDDLLLKDSTCEHLWTLTAALGISEITASALERSIPHFETAEKLLELENFEEVLEKCRNLRSTDVPSVLPALKKILEKKWVSATKDEKKIIYEGLSRISLMVWPLRTRAAHVPLEKLPESCLLTHLVKLFDDKNNIEAEKLAKVLKAFTGLTRKDGKVLPPIDWESLLLKSSWRTEMEASVEIACLRSTSKILFELTMDGTLETLSPDCLQILARNLISISKVLPETHVGAVVRKLHQLISTSEDADLVDSIAQELGRAQSVSSIKGVLAELLPKLDSPIQVTDILLQNLHSPESFAVSGNFQLWIASKNKDKVDIKTVCKLISDEKDSEKRAVLLAILGANLQGINDQKRSGLILDLITQSNLSGASNDPSYVQIFLTLLATTSGTSLPINWFSESKNLLTHLTSRRGEYIEKFVKSDQSETSASHVLKFLSPFVGDEPILQCYVSREMIKALLARCDSNLLSELPSGLDFWKKILLY